MKKSRILAIILALVFVIALAAACGEAAPAPAPAPPPAPPPAPTPDPTPTPTTPGEEEKDPDPVTLKWAVWDAEIVTYYAPLIDAYKEIAPHITIEMVDLGASDYENILQTQLMGSHDYDLIKVRGIPQYVNNTNADMLMELDEFLPGSGIDLANYRGMPEQHMRGGPLYSLPFRSDFWVVYYNVDLFDAAGVDYPHNQMTYDAWVEIIKAVTSGSGQDKVYGNHFHNWRSTTTLFGILDGKTVGEPNFGWMKHLYETTIELEDGGFVPRRTDNVAGGIHHRMKWAPQEIAMVNMGTWFMAEMDDWDFNWAMAAYPVPTSALYGNTFGNVTQLSIPRGAAHPQEAFDFIAFVCSEKGAGLLASVGQFPAFMTDDALNVITSKPGFPQDAQSRAALQPKNVFLELPIIEEAGEIDNILSEVHADILDRQISIEDGIKMMEDRVKQLLG